MHNKNRVIFIPMALGFLVLGCQKTSVQYTGQNKSVINDEISEQVLELVLSDPDSIPENIKDMAAVEVRRHGCDGIHIVNAGREEQNPKFCVTFLNDFDGPVERILMDMEGGIENLTDADKDYLGFNWESRSMKKTDQPIVCWHLPTVYKDTYLSGSNYTFTQLRYLVTGTYAKLIDNLHDWDDCDYCSWCYGGQFYGSWGDCISSHVWYFQSIVDAGYTYKLEPQVIEA
ncbi:hypothetical protein JW935_28390 [candidate division KSB1 bacterium]|nr:hypothetical protein [candidate division KSB1 bacterium]